ncbi:MAG: sugar transferase [Candidatus Roizmanbacteria bacterium]
MLYWINDRLYFGLKRLIDFICSLLGIIIGSPLLIAIALLIKSDSPGPVIFRQKRMGLYGKEFRIFKFRTMVVDAEKVLENDPKLLEAYQKNSYKIKDDPRVTKIGDFLRKSSLDELPQLFNIFSGDMSIVGPRAYKKDEMENQLSIHPELKKFAETVIDIKPGLTGMWQISGRSEIGFEKRILLDYDYANKKSILFDMAVMLKTVPVVLLSRGAW